MRVPDPMSNVRDSRSHHKHTQAEIPYAYTMSGFIVATYQKPEQARITQQKRKEAHGRHFDVKRFAVAERDPLPASTSRPRQPPVNRKSRPDDSHQIFDRPPR